MQCRKGKFLLETDTQWVCRKGKKSLRPNFHQDERCWYCWRRSFPKREKDFQMRPLLVPSRWLSIVRHNGGHQHWGWLEKRGRKKSRKNESIATERGIVLNQKWDRKKWQKAKSIGAIYRESGRPCVHVCHPITLVMADSLFLVKQHIIILTLSQTKVTKSQLWVTCRPRKVFLV